MLLSSRERLKPLSPPRLRHRRGAPVAWFLADRAGAWIDASDSRFAVASHGTIGRTASPYGPALKFDGSSSYVSFINPLKSTGVGSVSALVMSPAGADGRLMNDLGNDYWIGSVSGSWRALVFDGTNKQVIGPLIVNGRWTRLCMTWDGSNMKLYVDGVLAGAIAAGIIPIGDRGATAAIGATTQPAQFFGGSLDDVRFYDYPLTPAQVAVEFADPWWRLRHRRPQGRQRTTSSRVPWHLLFPSIGP